MRAIFAILTFFLFGIGNLIPGYSSEYDLKSDLLEGPDHFFELQLQETAELLFTDSDPAKKANGRATESTIAEPNEEEFHSSEFNGKTNKDQSFDKLATNLNVDLGKDTSVLNHVVRQSLHITPHQPIFLLLEVFRI